MDEAYNYRNAMASNASFLFLHALNSLFRTMPVIKRRPAGPKRTSLSDFHVKLHKCPFSDLLHMTPHQLSTCALVFQVEGTLLKSTSLFPYFMLVALEAGGLLRAVVLFLAYPFLRLPIWVGLSAADEMSLKAMVFLCFFGIRKEGFNIGRTVLPKFFLEDVGVEGLEMAMRMRGRAVGVTDMPRVMVEGFLRDYLGIENTVGRELKVVHGYFVGLMEDKKVTQPAALLDGCFNGKQPSQYYSRVIGLCCANSSLDLQHHFSQCQEVYLVSKSEKRKWKTLPRDKYPKPLIFHDGRVAFRPTPVSTLVMFLWLPLGIPILLTRFFSGLLLPYSLSSPILAFTGTRTTVSASSAASSSQALTPGTVYVCNHRTLLDPLYVALTLSSTTTTNNNNINNITAVTYSLSRLNEAIAPVRLIRLTRDRDQDAKKMKEALSRGDYLVVCPEGTTCREPYLLRFSPLFAEMSREIVPVAIDVKVNMFYGTSASGLKCLDPFFHFLNPFPVYNLKFLEKVKGALGENATENSSLHVANRVQADIARALRFGCTSLTRRDKYMSLAGNEGIVQRK